MHDDRLRERLLEEATRLLALGGRDGVSLRVLASSCGTSTTAVYRLFGDRARLLEVVLLRAAEEFARAQSEAVEAEDPERSLLELARAYRTWALAHPHRFLVLFDPSGEHAPALQEFACRTRAPLLERVERAVEAGVLAGPADRIAASLWSAVHGCTLLQLGGALPEEAGLFEELARAALRGWRPDPAPSARR